jgi:hypothetical protein
MFRFNHTLSPSTRRQLDTPNKAANRKAPLHQKTVTATTKLTSSNEQKLNYSVPHNEAAPHENRATTHQTTTCRQAQN